MVSLDIEEAYDTVWIYGLLYELIPLKLLTYLIFLLRAFLEGRSFTVRLNDAFSTPQNTPSAYTKGQFYPQLSSLSTFLTCHIHLTPNWHCMQTTLPFSLSPGEPTPSLDDSLMP